MAPVETRKQALLLDGSNLPRLVTVEPGDTLADMAVRVYGRQSYTLLDLLQTANPAVDDPSRIIAGDVLLFPSLEPQTRMVESAQGWKVVAVTTPSLREALATQRMLEGRFGRPVEIETLGLYDGPDLYRVFVSGIIGPDDASRIAGLLGPVLKD